MPDYNEPRYRYIGTNFYIYITARGLEQLKQHLFNKCYVSESCVMSIIHEHDNTYHMVAHVSENGTDLNIDKIPLRLLRNINEQ